MAQRDENLAWRRLQNHELRSFHCSHDIVRVIKSRNVRWAGHVSRIKEGRNAIKILIGKPRRRRLLGKPRRI